MRNYVKPSDFLDDQLPVHLQRLIPATLKRAYKAADELIKDKPILEVTSAKANYGRLRSWAVDLEFERLLQTGRWPYDYDWAPFERPTGRYLRIRLESSIISISLIADPSFPPRQVRFRANNALGNPTAFLFEEMNKEIEISGFPSFLLVHGHQTPDFAHIGMPSPSCRSWIYKTDNLYKIPHIEQTIPDNIPQVEAQDQEAILSLKDRIKKWQRDSNG